MIPDASLTWWIRPAATQLNGVTYVGAVSDLGAGIAQDSDGHRRRLLAFGADDHNAGALLISPSKAPLAFFCGHNDDATLRWSKGSAIGDITSLGRTRTISAAGNVTYSQVWDSGDDVWWLTRVLGSGTTRNWTFFKSPNYGDTFGTATVLLSGDQAYITSTQVGTTVHCGAYQHPDENQRTVYYFAIDLTTGAITKADGSSLGNLDGTNLPLSLGSLDLAYTAPVSNGVRLFEVTERGDGPEIGLATWTDDADTVYRHVHWGGSSWTSAQIVAAGAVIGFTPSTHYNGGISFPSTVNQIYVSRESAGEWFIETWQNDNGWSLLTEHATSSSEILARPYALDNGLVYVSYSSYASFTDWSGAGVILV